MTIRARRLTSCAAVAAVLVTVGGMLLATRALRSPAFDPSLLDRFAAGDRHIGWLCLDVLIGCGAVAVAQLARLRVRVGDGAVMLAWGEAAMVVLGALLPPGWVPLVMLGGVSAAQLVLYLGRRARTLDMAVFSVSALTVTGALAAGVVAWIGPADRTPLDATVVVALCAGAAVYTLVSTATVALKVVADRGGRFLTTFADVISSKLLMVVGNIAVGLLVVFVWHTDIRFLVLLPPLFWLLHQLYAYRLRGDDERRTWQAFAEATGELNRLDERGAVAAGIAGAVQLFHARSVEVLLAGRIYGGGPDQPLRELDAPSPEPYTERPLLVAGNHIGELRLRLADEEPIGNRDRLMFAAYGDAFAAAVHDAVTHDELLAMSERTTYDAVHDPLTGLLNRSTLLLRGNHAARRSPGTSMAVLLLDVDHFKEVNNTLGHAAGDRLLQVIAARVTASAGAGELLARLGGDEFALVLSGLPADRDALTYAQSRARRLGQEVAVPTEVGGVMVSVEASVGVAVAPAGDVDMTELLRRADIAMYQAKRGGQPVDCYEPGRDEASTDRLALLAELREALGSRRNNQLVLAIQPAVDLATGEVSSVEMLVRWDHPRRGLLEPAQFLPTVEQSELIGPFTRHVLDRALAIAARWRAAGLYVPVAVNMSPRGLHDPDLPAVIGALLTRHRVPAGTLTLEITESVVMSNLPVIDQVLARLRELGVHLAVDDFGTGYSSLTFLARVAVDEVKIDRSFVATMADSPQAAAIVRATVELARELGLRVVAEGVETAQQRASLLALGCGTAQGFHFYHPLTEEKATAVLRRSRPTFGALRAEDAG